MAVKLAGSMDPGPRARRQSTELAAKARSAKAVAAEVLQRGTDAARLEAGNVSILLRRYREPPGGETSPAAPHAVAGWRGRRGAREGYDRCFATDVDHRRRRQILAGRILESSGLVGVPERRRRREAR
jgi:hypothetical protein